MNSGMISVRYAKALLACAEEQREDKRIFDMMSTLADNFVAHSELTAVLKNPTLSEQQKKQLIIAAAGNADNSLFDRFVDLLLHNKRTDVLQRIALDYCDLYLKDSKICVGRVTTATPLDAKTDRHIREFLKKWSGRDVELNTKTNPELLGGFVLDVGDKRLDASIAGQLRRIKKTLAR
ncbi:MAG: F0F1 ATP synthase subunit delta [Paludibacteraceae bacterium]